MPDPRIIPAPGSVIKADARVLGQLQGARYLVKEVVQGHGGPFPNQVYCHFIEHHPGGTYPRGQTGAFRAFPLEWCIIDEKRSAQWKEARREATVTTGEGPEAGGEES